MEKEIPLLLVQESEREREWKWKWRRVREEVKRVSSIGLPMMVVMMSQYLVRAAPKFTLGHLGEQLSLSSASIATSLCNATGFTVLFGMASALETLCGQANGAGQHGRLGTFAAASIASLLLLCFPISLIWINAAKLLALTGQDPSISAAAGLYAVQLIPALFASAVLESLVRFLQSQSLILPILWSSAASLCINLPLCWAFIFKLDMGSGGAALAVTLASWFNACCLLLYVVYSPACRRTSLIPDSKGDMLAAMKDLFRIGLPSAFMFCLEGWTYELIILLSGLLPNPQVETSVVTMCYMIGGLHSYIPYSFGAAASTLVSNELGAGKPEAARFAVYTIVILAAGEFLIAAIAVYTCRHIIGYAFSTNKKIVDYIDEMAPFISICIAMDGLSNVLSGVVRGSGWQEMGAYVKPRGFLLGRSALRFSIRVCFPFKRERPFSGVVAGATVQAFSFSLMTALTDWEQQATTTRMRVFGGNFQVDGNVLVV